MNGRVFGQKNNVMYCYAINCRVSESLLGLYLAINKITIECYCFLDGTPDQSLQSICMLTSMEGNIDKVNLAVTPALGTGRKHCCISLSIKLGRFEKKSIEQFE